MDILKTLFEGTLNGIGPFFLLLGLLIFIHEWGHFIVARLCGVRVETFSIGFGKKILSRKWGDTNYCLSIFPLGGYVKMYGDDPTAEYPEEDREVAFLCKPVWQRIAIVLAGPLMNLVFAIFLFGAIGAIGEPLPGNQIGDISNDSSAFSQGFRSGDKITEIDGQSFTYWKDIKEYIETRPDERLLFKVEREYTSEIEEFVGVTKLADNPFIFSTRRKIGWIEGLSIASKAAVVSVDGKDAADAGMKTFDLVSKVGQYNVETWRDLKYYTDKALREGAGTAGIEVSDYKDTKAEVRKLKLVTALAHETAQPLDLSELGIHSPDLVLYHVNAVSPAYEAGMRAGDQIVSINGRSTEDWSQLLESVTSYETSNGPMAFGILRNGQSLEIQVTPELTDIPTAQGGMEQRYAIGIRPTIISTGNPSLLSTVNGPIDILVHGVQKSYDWSKLILISMVRLVQNEVSAKNIGGIISIGRVASQSYDMGLIAFLKMMAIISINLFILNLLPVPVLDGGHLVFFTIEAIKGSPLSLKKMEMAQQLGFVLLISLMMFALFNDISNLISSW